MSLFVLASKDGWVNIMYTGLDAVGVDMQVSPPVSYRSSDVSSLLPPTRRICNRRCLFVCLLPTLRKSFRTDFHEIFREGWHWAIEQMVKFWWRSGSPSGYRDCVPDSSLLVIREVVNGHKSTAHADSPDGGTGKTCLGRGMHSPSASNYLLCL